MTAMAKVFMNGGSQAIRLPKEFRFDEDEVCVKRLGSSALVIYPKGKGWDLMEEAIGKAGGEWPDRDQPEKAEERPPL